MMTSRLEGRIARLEAGITPIRGCAECQGYVHRIRLVTIAPDGTELSSNQPESCPACGERTGPRPPLTNTIQIVRELRDHVPAGGGWEDV